MENSPITPNFQLKDHINDPKKLTIALSDYSVPTNPANIQNEKFMLGISDVLKKGDDNVYCSICYLECSSESSSVSCQYHHNFCSECYRQYILTKMNNFEVLNIPCPEQSCSVILSHEIIKSVLDTDQYNRYQELLFKKLTYKNLSQKYCPNIKCLKPLTLDQSKDITVCTCGTKICNICVEVLHPGKPCLDIKDADFELFAKDNEIKFCQICKTAVSRVEGCLHITCSVCDYEWCWTCGKQYSHNHECLGEWNPGVPSKETQKQENQRRKKGCDMTAVLTFIIEIPLMIPMALLGGILYAVSWLFIYYSATQKRKGVKLALWKVVPLALISATIGPVLLIFVGPFMLHSYIKKRREIKRQEILAEQLLLHPVNKNSRWLKGNIKDFKYTEQAKPEHNQVAIEMPGRQ